MKWSVFVFIRYNDSVITFSFHYFFSGQKYKDALDRTERKRFQLCSTYYTLCGTNYVYIKYTKNNIRGDADLIADSKCRTFGEAVYAHNSSHLLIFGHIQNLYITARLSFFHAPMKL